MKILIVDDEERIRMVIREYCQNNNYETEEAESGKEALQKIKNNDARNGWIYHVKRITN